MNAICVPSGEKLGKAQTPTFAMSATALSSGAPGPAVLDVSPMLASLSAALGLRRLLVPSAGRLERAPPDIALDIERLALEAVIVLADELVQVGFQPPPDRRLARGQRARR